MKRCETPTARALDVLAFIRRFIDAYSVAPTRAEIGVALGISRPTAEQHLQALKRARLIKLRKQWRGIELRS